MLPILQDEDIVAATIPAVPQDGPDLLAARVICGDVRQALDRILDDVARGARDLQDGLIWSQNLERFELASMKQARILAKFPIGTTDERFGALVHRARASFVAFRETARREIIGMIDSDTDSATCDLALKKVASRSALADASLKSVDEAILQYLTQFSVAPQDGGSRRRTERELTR